MFFTDAAPASHSHGYTYADSHLDAERNRPSDRHADGV
jgi:hypothetical protein